MMHRIGHATVLVLVVVALGMVLVRIPGPVQQATKTGTAGLQISDGVIQAKIARKQARLDSGWEKPQHPDGYEKYRSQVRPHPEGTNIKQMLLDAKKQVAAMPELSAEKDAGLWNWQWLGPGNIGGRIRAILTHPTQEQTLWIGSAGGGIWKTVNGGASWFPLNDFLPSLAVTSLAMDPNNSDVIYAGTGEGFYNQDALPGAGIFKTTNGGDSWIQLSSTANTDAQFINDIAHHPNNSGTLIACGVSESGVGMIWRSTNGGDNWDKFITNERPMDVKYDPDDPEIVIVGTWSGAWRSTNGGQQWDEISDGTAGRLPNITGRCEIAFGEGTDVVYASLNVPRGVDLPRGEIWRSLDNGVTWERRSNLYHLSGQGWYDNVIWVAPNSINNIMVGGVDLFSSFDGGTSLAIISDWTRYHLGTSAHADIHAIVPHINFGIDGNSHIFIGNDGGIQIATNGLLTEPHSGWVNLANNLGITQFFGADASPDGHLILGGTQDNDDLRYTSVEGAQNWYQAETGDGTYCAIDPVHADTLFTCYPYLGMERSYDGGDYYYPIRNGLDDTGDDDRALFIAPFALDKVATNHLIAGGRSIWRSYDRGSNWHETLGPMAGNPLCSAVEISPSGSLVVWVGYDNGYIYKTEDGTLNWTEVEGFGGPLPNEVVTDIEISPHDSDVVIVTFGGYYTGRVWRTENRGATWTNISGLSGSNPLPAVQVNCITYHPSDTSWIYAGTDIGLFASEDNGYNWNVTPRFGQNDGPVYTEVSDLIWHSQGVLVVVTHGRGMFQCQPLEAVWVDQAFHGVEEGTLTHPFNTIYEGYLVAGNGSRIYIKSGDYNEVDMVMKKRLEIVNTDGSVIIR